MIAKVDQNHDGLITFDEFVEIFGNVPNATLEGVARAWVHSAGRTRRKRSHTHIRNSSACGSRAAHTAHVHPWPSWHKH